MVREMRKNLFGPMGHIKLLKKQVKSHSNDVSVS